MIFGFNHVFIISLVIYYVIIPGIFDGQTFW